MVVACANQADTSVATARANQVVTPILQFVLTSDQLTSSAEYFQGS